MKFSHLRDDSRLTRRLLLILFVVVLSAAMVATGILAWVLPGRATSSADRLAEIGDVMVGGTLFLAFIAAIVAVAAYAVATGLPALEFQIRFLTPVGHIAYGANMLFLEIDPDAQPPLRSGNAEPYISSGPVLANIYVRNTGSYSAQNPAVVIHLIG